MRRLRWLPVTDEAWLTSPAVLDATMIGVTNPDRIPWFDPTDPMWNQWNPRFVSLPKVERDAILNAAADPARPWYEVRTATVNGVAVRYTCGREPNLVLPDPYGIHHVLFQMLDQLDPQPEPGVTQHNDDGSMWALAPLDPRWAALACRESLVIVGCSPGGCWPWDCPGELVLTRWRPLT